MSRPSPPQRDHRVVHVERQHLTETRGGGSTRDPIERALTDDDPEAVPRLAPTRLPHSGPRQICVLLLGGMSAPNPTLRTMESSGRPAECPRDGCGEDATTLHFLLRCTKTAATGSS